MERPLLALMVVVALGIGGQTEGCLGGRWGQGVGGGACSCSTENKEALSAPRAPETPLGEGHP